MAQEKDYASPDFPEAPVLVAPRSEAVVNGRDVTFEWEPVEGASAYFIEVATDTTFDDPVVEQNTGDKTALALTDAFGTEGQTYYWRVLAKDERGWSHGDRVESFVAATADKAEEAEYASARPDDDAEGSGPYAALVGSALREAAAEATGSDELLEEEREAGVAHEGVEAGQILGIAAAILLAVILIVFTLFFWVDNVSQSQSRAVVGLSGYPELRETEVEAARLLDQYEVVSEEERTYRIPIQEAMDLIVNEQYEAPASGAEPTFSDVVTDSTVSASQSAEQRP